MRRSPCWIAFGIVIVSISPPARAAAPFEWKDGDRVVLIGDTLIERDQKYGYLETRITARNPDKSITFRNLGWSGDTALGLSRARFGPPAEGFQHLKDHVTALKPTVLIVGYGMAESFNGEEGLPGFVSRMNELLDAVTASNPRLIFLSPIAHEDLGRPLPDPASHNRALAGYRDAIKKLAGERSGWFVDLYAASATAQKSKIPPLTENGIHPDEFGYWYLARVIDLALLRADEEPTWVIRIDREGKVSRSSLTKVADARKVEGGVRFKVTDETLPMPSAFLFTSDEKICELGNRTLVVDVSGPDEYTLKIDGKSTFNADPELWAKGVPLYALGVDDGPEFEQLEALRATINAKNELYFYRWRPQNETYLFGFRKHEQGNNAREIPLFDPLVEAREKEIARLRKPVPHVYELTRDNEVNP